MMVRTREPPDRGDRNVAVGVVRSKAVQIAKAVVREVRAFRATREPAPPGEYAPCGVKAGLAWVAAVLPIRELAQRVVELEARRGLAKTMEIAREERPELTTPQPRC